MIETAEKERQARSVELGAAGVVHGAVPGDDLRQVTVAVDGRQARIVWTLQVAAIGDFDAL